MNYDLKENNREMSTDLRSADYWCGWALIQYQNYSGFRFKRIHRLIKYKELLKLYPKYHQMDITKLYDYLDDLSEMDDII